MTLTVPITILLLTKSTGWVQPRTDRELVINAHKFPPSSFTVIHPRPWNTTELIIIAMIAMIAIIAIIAIITITIIKIIIATINTIVINNITISIYIYTWSSRAQLTSYYLPTI